MKVLILVLALAASTFAEERQCNAPNGGGINGIIDEVIPMLPKDRLYEAVLIASSSPEMQPLLEYLRSEEFVGSLQVLTKHQAFVSIVAAACEELYFDGLYYFNKLAGEIGLPTINRQTRALKPGVLGLFNSIMNILPKEELQKIFEEKVKTDQYVQKALIFVYSENFKNKIETLKALPEYNQFLSKLRDLGVEVDEITEMINDLIKKLSSYVPKA